jgi:hypothetical protein
MPKQTENVSSDDVEKLNKMLNEVALLDYFSKKCFVMTVFELSLRGARCFTNDSLSQFFYGMAIYQNMNETRIYLHTNQ